MSAPEPSPLAPGKLARMRVNELREQCELRGLATDGLKTVLVERLREVRRTPPQQWPRRPGRPDDRRAQYLTQPHEDAASGGDAAHAEHPEAAEEALDTETHAAEPPVVPAPSAELPAAGAARAASPSAADQPKAAAAAARQDDAGDGRAESAMDTDVPAERPRSPSESDSAISLNEDALFAEPTPKRTRTDSVDRAPPSGDPVFVHVTNFVRPFTLSQARDMLAGLGPLAGAGSEAFWMDSIKSQAVVQYATSAVAEAAVAAVNGMKWPKLSGKPLSARTVTADEAATLRTAGARPAPAKPRSAPPAGIAAAAPLPAPGPALAPSAKPVADVNVKGDGADSSEVGSSRAVDCSGSTLASPPPAPSQQQQQQPPPQAPNQRPSVSATIQLDDLFYKTRTTPCLYWLPAKPNGPLPRPPRMAT